MQLTSAFPVQLDTASTVPLPTTSKPDPVIAYQAVTQEDRDYRLEGTLERVGSAIGFLVNLAANPVLNPTLTPRTDCNYWWLASLNVRCV